MDARLTAACAGGGPPDGGTPDAPPARCPDGSTFEGRLVSELTYDANAAASGLGRATLNVL